MGDNHIDFADAQGILKDFFRPGFQSQVARDLPPLWQRLKPKADKLEGIELVFSAKMERAMGVGARSSSAQTLPYAVPSKSERIRVGLKRLYGTIQYDAMMLKGAGNSGRGAFINYTKGEMDDIKVALVDDCGRQAFGTNKGIIAGCGVTAASKTVVLAATANMYFFKVGMHIDIVLQADGTPVADGADRTIVAISRANKTITLDAAGAVVATDATHGIVNQGSYGAEATGLGQIVSDTENIFGLTTANFANWQSYVNPVNAAFTEKELFKSLLEVKARSGKMPSLIVSSPSKQQQYWYLLTGTKTFDVAKSPMPIKEIGSGYYEISIACEGQRIPWIADINCKNTDILALDEENIGIQHYGEPDFMDPNGNGNILISNAAGSAGKPTFKAVIEYYWEMYCNRRNSHMIMTGVNDLAGW